MKEDKRVPFCAEKSDQRENCGLGEDQALAVLGGGCL
jgi:hypothetical protein